MQQYLVLIGVLSLCIVICVLLLPPSMIFAEEVAFLDTLRKNLENTGFCVFGIFLGAGRSPTGPKRIAVSTTRGTHLDVKMVAFRLILLAAAHWYAIYDVENEKNAFLRDSAQN